MSNPIRILPHYTYDDYVHWEGKWELIHGIPHAMSPAPSPQHQFISSNLLAEFRSELKKCSNCSVLQPVDYKISDELILQPDLLVVCKPISKNFLDFPPSLVVEVLSPSTALIDRYTKLEIYRSEGIRYYLIISPDAQEVEVFQLNSGEYHLKEKGKNFSFFFQLEDDCTATVDFKEIWK